MINALESRNSSGFGLLHSSVIVTSSGNPCGKRPAAWPAWELRNHWL